VRVPNTPGKVLCHRPAQAAGNSGCVDGNDSLSVSARDVCGSSDAAIPRRGELEPVSAADVPRNCPEPLQYLSRSYKSTVNEPLSHQFEDALEHDTHPTGRLAMPKTRRVDDLSAPNTLTSSSEAASATFGARGTRESWRVKPRDGLRASLCPATPNAP